MLIYFIFQGYFTDIGTIIWLPNTNEVTLKAMGKIQQYQTTTKHNKSWTFALFPVFKTNVSYN